MPNQQVLAAVANSQITVRLLATGIKCTPTRRLAIVVRQGLAHSRGRHRIRQRSWTNADSVFGVQTVRCFCTQSSCIGRKRSSLLPGMLENINRCTERIILLSSVRATYVSSYRATKVLPRIRLSIQTKVIILAQRTKGSSHPSHVTRRVLSSEGRAGCSGTVRRSVRNSDHLGCVGGAEAMFVISVTFRSRDWKGWLPRWSLSAPRFRRRPLCQIHVMVGSSGAGPLHSGLARVVRPPTAGFARSLLVVPPRCVPAPLPMQWTGTILVLEARLGPMPMR